MSKQRSFPASGLLVIALSACSSTTVTQSDESGGQSSGTIFMSSGGHAASQGTVTSGGSKSSSGGTSGAATAPVGGWSAMGGTRAGNTAGTIGTSMATGGKSAGGVPSTTGPGSTPSVGAAGGSPSGGATMGGAAMGGATNGGMSTSPPMGGSTAASGGAISGGATAVTSTRTGGSATTIGGTASTSNTRPQTSGGATGGRATGGAATGGAATGGVATGGAATGGRATGGAATGGVANCSLTVTRVLVDAATATLSANGTSCEPSCSLSVPCGSAVTLTPAPNGTTGFAGWDDSTGACLGTTSPCAFNLSTNASIKGTFQPYNRAFVTSTSSNSKLGGLTSADATCRTLASSANLPGASKYVAFLSTGSVDAIDRLGSARGWLRTDGLPFADSVSSIQSGTVWYPLALTETGSTSKLDGQVFTGSRPDGTNDSGDDCNGWTDATAAYNVQAGLIGGGSALWLTWASGDCTQIPSAPIYCLGTAYSAPLAPPVATAGRRVFLSATKFSPGSGKTIKDADNLCVVDATTNGICTSSSNCPFKAVLAQSGASAKSHFTNQDGSTPIVRLDNMKVASSSSYFWQGTLSAPVSLHANGAYSSQGERLFTGAATLSSAGTAASTCSNWSDATVTTGVNYGVPAMGPLAFNWTTLWGCNESNPIYCLEDIP